MAMCSKSWKGVGCVSESLPGRDVCAIHAKFPNFAPPTGELAEIDLDPNRPMVLDACFDEDGECPGCDGSGNCECHCGDEHDCRDCDGRGKATTCRFCESSDDFDADSIRRRHLEGCGARSIFIAHVAANALTADEKKLYDRLLKEIGPDAQPDPDDCAVKHA
jgi:hypothetical protein